MENTNWIAILGLPPLTPFARGVRRVSCQLNEKLDFHQLIFISTTDI
jgi:hypothetical protein